MPRRITKVGERSNPVYRSFIASFGVANIGSRLPQTLCSRRFFVVMQKVDEIV